MVLKGRRRSGRSLYFGSGAEPVTVKPASDLASVSWVARRPGSACICLREWPGCLLVHARKRPGIDRQSHFLARPGGDVHALKSHQRVNRPTVCGVLSRPPPPRRAGGAGVRHGDGRGDRIAGLERLGGELDRPVFESGIAEPVPKAPQRLAGVIAVSRPFSP